MRTIKTTTGAEIPLDGDLLTVMETLYQEIADQLHLPEGTVKSRINRGRHELARQITRLRDKGHTSLATAHRAGRRAGA